MKPLVHYTADRGPGVFGHFRNHCELSQWPSVRLTLGTQLIAAFLVGDLA